MMRTFGLFAATSLTGFLLTATQGMAQTTQAGESEILGLWESERAKIEVKGCATPAAMVAKPQTIEQRRRNIYSQVQNALCHRAGLPSTPDNYCGFVTELLSDKTKRVDSARKYAAIIPHVQRYFEKEGWSLAANADTFETDMGDLRGFPVFCAKSVRDEP